MREEAAVNASLLRRNLPLCALSLVLAVTLVVVVLYLLDGNGGGRALNLEQPGPFTTEPIETPLGYLEAHSNTEPGLTYEMSEGRIRNLRYLSAEPEPLFDVTVGEVVVKAIDTEHWPPRFADMRLYDLDAEIASPGWPPWLRRIQGDAILAFQLHPESNTLDVPLAALSAPGQGRLDIAFSLDKVDAARLGSSLGSAEISTLSLTFYDEGLFERGIEEIAQQERTTQEVVRRQVAAMATALQAKSSYPYMREFFAALRTVMERDKGGVVLEISATPSEPFPLAELGRLRFWPLPDLARLRKLNLHIDAK